MVNKKISFGSVGTLTITAEATPRLHGFRLHRVKGLEFRWKQELSASLTATLQSKANMKSDKKTGELLKQTIPSLGFSIRIPVVGKCHAGGYVALNYVREMKITRTAKLSVQATYIKKQLVTAKVSSLSLDASDDGSSSSGSGGLEVEPNAAASLSISGFFGVRPVLGMGVTYERKRAFRKRIKKSGSADIGADFGVALSADYKYPPFSPYSGSGFTIGQCSSCHAIQGGLSLKGKHLSLQVSKNGKKQKKRTLVRNLFETRLGTVCAVTQSC